MSEITNFFLALLIAVNSVNSDTTELNGMYKRPIDIEYKDGKMVEANSFQLTSFKLTKTNDSKWILSNPFSDKTEQMEFIKNTVKLKDYNSYERIIDYDWVKLNDFSFSNSDKIYSKRNDSIPFLLIEKSPDYKSIIFKAINKERNNEFDELLINYN